jgi:hypothetical protein
MIAVVESATSSDRVIRKAASQLLMTTGTQPSSQEVLVGLVEQITYHNPENGFCVLRAKARGYRDVVTEVDPVGGTTSVSFLIGFSAVPIS